MILFAIKTVKLFPTVSLWIGCLCCVSWYNRTTMDLLREAAPGWKDYALLDSGEFEKLERFGDVIFVRPEPQAIWAKSNEADWDAAHAVYRRNGQDGEWDFLKDVPESWEMRWNDLAFHIQPTSFKHTGLFPEQAGNWEYIRATVKPGMKVLNLFGYTGGATLAALSVGGEVVHVDASKPVVTWARENTELSGLADKPVRWIVDDVMKFVGREVKRGNHYDMIVMDPPAFGHGPDGEMWQFEDDLPHLLHLCASILNPGAHLIVNAYSLGFPALSIENLVLSAFPQAKIHGVVELTLQETTPRAVALPTGIVVRAQL